MRQSLFSYSLDMLVRCPKCHFEQPKDPFCAKCGIEMSTFKPPAETLMGKVLKNATAVFFIVMISLFAGTFFFYKSSKLKQDVQDNEVKKSSLSQRQYISANEPQIEVAGAEKTERNDASEPAPSPTGTQTADGSKAAIAKDIKDQSADEIREHLESQLFKKDTATKEPSPPAAQYELRVYYAEVSSKGLDMLLQESRASGQSANTDFSQGVINLPMTKVLSYRDDFNVYSEVSKHLEKNKNADWFHGLKSSGPNSDIGLNHTVVVKDSPNGHNLLEIKVSKRYQVSLADGSSKSFQTMDYVGSGEIEKEQTYFIAEILSKYPMSSQQEYLTAISPFEIYKSQNFLGGKTFSVFFYTLENK